MVDVGSKHKVVWLVLHADSHMNVPKKMPKHVLAMDIICPVINVLYLANELALSWLANVWESANNQSANQKKLVQFNF